MLKSIKIIAGDIKKLYNIILLNIFNFMLKGAPFGILFIVLQELLKSKNNINIKKIIWLFSGMALIMFLHLVVSMKVRTKSFTRAHELSAQARLRLGEHLRKLPLNFFQTRNSGDITSLLLQDMAKVELVFSHYFIDLIACMVIPAIMALFFFLVNWQMAAIALLSIPLAIPALIIGQKIILTIGKQQINSRQDTESRLIEYIQGIKVIKAFNLTGPKFVRLDKSLKKLRNDSIKLESYTSGPVLGYMAMLELGYIAVLFFGGIFLTKGVISIPILLMFIIIGYKLYEPLQQSGLLLSQLRYMNIAAQRMTDVINIKTIFSTDNDAELKHYDIEFSDVSFKYHKNNILENFNVTFPENSISALVGPSGSGKTTIINLIARFWEVNSGKITIDGIDVKQINPQSLYSNISMVFQDVYLFNDTVFNNIKIGKKNATYDEVIAAAKIANSHEFIMKMEHGYDTVIGEGGATLSGGEKQRISIARAIIKNAPIILLDEATASLDPENELLIQQAINKMIKSKTTIVIAHRLKSVINADQIIVIDDGQIIEKGKHHELMQQKGFYRKLWDEQQMARQWKINRLKRSPIVQNKVYQKM